MTNTLTLTESQRARLTFCKTSFKGKKKFFKDRKWDREELNLRRIDNSRQHKMVKRGGAGC